MSYEMLQAAAFGMQVFNTINTHNEQASQAAAQYDQAQRQVAMNNNLAYNAYLHLNEEQMLKAKANALNTDSLQRAIRRAKATEAAKIQSQGGDSTFGTGDARLRNVMRQGAEALARKDLNFQTTLNDFVKRRKNVGLETLDKNNRAFSGLSSPPSATGLVTNLAGLGISTYADVNYYTAPDGTIKSRTSS